MSRIEWLWHKGLCRVISLGHISALGHAILDISRRVIFSSAVKKFCFVFSKLANLRQVLCIINVVGVLFDLLKAFDKIKIHKSFVAWAATITIEK